MNTILWILQTLIAIIFMYSGINKSIFDKQVLMSRGQTGVEKLPIPFIRFIGISEILGAIGLVFPILLHTAPVLSVISALCFAFIMVPAAAIHYLRKEYKAVLLNFTLLIICLFIAYGRTCL